MLGSYRLEQKLSEGEGGFGIVYRGTHAERAMGPAAVKVFTRELGDDPLARAAFEREVTILRELSEKAASHRLVKIRDSGISEDGLPWLAMQFIEGEPLEVWRKRMTEGGKPLPAQLIVGVLVDLLKTLEALDCAARPRDEGRLHGPVVHRDIKPGNIKIETKDRQLRAWLLDFGIAQSLFDEAATSDIPNVAAETAVDARATAMLAITPQYASPELCVPRPCADPRSDIFQVGLVGFELMTGQLYWDVWPHARRRLARSRHPRWLKLIIRQALSWERDRRFPTAAEFRVALQHPRRFLIGLAGPRRRLLRSISVLAAMAAAGAVVVMAIQSHRARKEFANLTGRIADLREEGDVLRRMAVAHSTSIAAPNGEGGSADQEAKLRVIEDYYNKLKTGEISNDQLTKCADEARKFASNYPNHRDQREVQLLMEWINQARAGRVEVQLVKFTETKMQSDWRLYYGLTVTGHKKQEGVLNVTKEAAISLPASIVPWAPETTVEIAFDNQMRQHEYVSRTYKLGGREIMTGPGEFTGELSPIWTDTNFKLIYHFKRIGFGSLPEIRW
jgi:serine/threonine protein kinase